MLNFDYYAPTKVVFGKDAQMRCAGLVKECGGTRVFLLYGGGSAVKSGLIGTIEQNLRENGLVCETLGGVHPNPYLSFARHAAEKAAAFGADFILAVGGGSVIDTAKAVGLALANPGVDLWDFWTKGRKPAGLHAGRRGADHSGGRQRNEQFVRAYR